MTNTIQEIDNIDQELARLRERRKAKVEKAFDEGIWDLLAALGYEGSKSKASAQPSLPTLIEWVEKARENASAETEQEAENVSAQSSLQTY